MALFGRSATWNLIRLRSIPVYSHGLARPRLVRAPFGRDCGRSMVLTANLLLSGNRRRDSYKYSVLPMPAAHACGVQSHGVASRRQPSSGSPERRQLRDSLAPKHTRSSHCAIRSMVPTLAFFGAPGIRTTCCRLGKCRIPAVPYFTEFSAVTFGLTHS
jgi:hypothetical protein